MPTPGHPSPSPQVRRTARRSRCASGSCTIRAAYCLRWRSQTPGGAPSSPATRAWTIPSGSFPQPWRRCRACSRISSQGRLAIESLRSGNDIACLTRWRVARSRPVTSVPRHGLVRFSSAAAQDCATSGRERSCRGRRWWSSRSRRWGTPSGTAAALTASPSSGLRAPPARARAGCSSR